MLIKKLQHLATYYELYEFVADTKNTQAQIKMYLINESSLQTFTSCITPISMRRLKCRKPRNFWKKVIE